MHNTNHQQFQESFAILSQTHILSQFEKDLTI